MNGKEKEEIYLKAFWIYRMFKFFIPSFIFLHTIEK